MKKSTLLSLATAGAIVATSVGTFAAWDQTTVDFTEASVTIDKAVTLTVDTINFAAPTDRAALITAEVGPIQETTANVTVKDVPTGAKDNYILETEATITNNDGSPIENGEVSVAVTPTDNALKGGAEDVHEIKITVTPNTNAAAGKTYKVNVTANIVDKPAA